MARKLTVTSEMAADYYEHMMYTRKPQVGAVQKYALAMVNHSFVRNGETLIVSWDFEGMNGQNRCLASMATGESFSTWVVFGMDPAHIGTIDDVIPRSLDQRIGSESGQEIKKSLVETATRMIQVDRITAETQSIDTLLYPKKILANAARDFINRYHAGLEFAMEHLASNNKGASASVRAAVAKCYYHTRKYPGGRERLAEACSVFSTGLYMDRSSDSAMVALYRNLTKGDTSPSLDHGLAAYRKAAFCLDKFMSKQNIQRCDQAKEDLFPMPEPASEFVKPDKALFRQVELFVKRLTTTKHDQPKEKVS